MLQQQEAGECGSIVEGTEVSSGRMCRAAAAESETTTETVALNRHNGADREETPEICTMTGAAYKCGETTGICDLV